MKIYKFVFSPIDVNTYILADDSGNCAIIDCGCYDKKENEILEKFNLENVTLISLWEFESPELLKVKPTRSIAEYCWTCTSSTILYVG